ncbi:MAG: SH3 domain-containing protein [Chloroflexota bacterium]
MFARKLENESMRRYLILLIFVVLSLSMTTSAQEQNIFTSPWRGEYFNNPYLAGEPIVTRFDQGIGYSWGTDAPAEGLPVDNFSVRWGKGGDLPAGTYRFIITADVAFRLYIDGEVILDTWETGTQGATIGRDIFIEAGYHNLQLDYRAFGGDALIFLDWGLAPNGEVAPQPTTVFGVNTVTITANTLNVRSEPRIANNVITRLTRGQQFSQVAISDDGRWVQLDLGNGTQGWVSASFVSADTAEITTEGLTGQTLRSIARLLIRTAPSLEADAIGLLLRGEDASIIGRSSDGNWWQINDNGRIGWVNATFVVLSPDVDADSIATTN